MTVRLEPIELSYDLGLLPPGRYPLRRWRYELWHGPRLLAAGWRLQQLPAERALRAHASRYAHRLYGLHPLHPDRGEPDGVWGRGTIVIDCGDLQVRLSPRALADGSG